MTYGISQKQRGKPQRILCDGICIAEVGGATLIDSLGNCTKLVSLANSAPALKDRVEKLEALAREFLPEADICVCPRATTAKGRDTGPPDGSCFYCRVRATLKECTPK